MKIRSVLAVLSKSSQTFCQQNRNVENVIDLFSCLMGDFLFEDHSVSNVGKFLRKISNGRQVKRIPLFIVRYRPGRNSIPPRGSAAKHHVRIESARDRFAIAG